MSKRSPRAQTFPHPADLVSEHESDVHQAGLRKGILTPTETLAQSIAGIAPSATPGMLIPIVFGFAGNGTWLSYVLATIGVLFTARCINVFASRSACPGSLYTFVNQGLGLRAGTLTGCALLFAYIFCGAACVTEFAIYAMSFFAHLLNVSTGSLPMIVGSALLISYIAHKNIKLSANLMLWLEMMSIGLILIVVGLTLSKTGFQFDLQQLGLHSVKPENVRMGLVMAIFGFVAFESAASLGREAIEPLRSVPRAIMRSVMFSGTFFVVSSYAMVMSFKQADVALDKCATPLLTMSTQVGIPALGHLIDAGIMVSFFAAGLANLNGAARIVYKMSADGFLHSRLSATHTENRTPHIAVIVSTLVSLSIAVVLDVFNLPLVDIVGWLGTLATFGFIFAYIATSIAALKYLRRTRELTIAKCIVVAASVAVMTLSIVGSLYPAPPFPYNVLPCIFGVYMVAAAFHVCRSGIACNQSLSRDDGRTGTSSEKIVLESLT
jgi:amino acid transporter